MAKTVDEIGQLREFLRRHPRLVVLTGAGISAASGIPTYRDDSGTWRYRTPIQHQDFLRDKATRQRYWARSMAGWPTLRDALPNAAHHAIARLESRGNIETVITQNVDRLHQRAGSRRVIDLHGRVDRVRCMHCGALSEREALQSWLEQHNSLDIAGTRARPDGDSDIAATDLAQFVVPDCDHCGGDLTPDVVFYGGNVPRARVDSCRLAIERADALLVVGSSLQVYSGYRFCRLAATAGKPLAIINTGVTRADQQATLRLFEPAASLLHGALV
ncbi:NAD-dependent protein deacetylase [Haliea sp. E17]|uniref:NAD-dependent protein deacetylase n=1 Tax=Haliea sp. E17 TaxID=3401576 RepID=UPI003AAFD7DD